MSGLLKTLSPEIIDALTKGIRPVIRDEMRNFLNGRITRIPDGFDDEFAGELRGLVQDIGEGGISTTSTVAGELIGMIEGGLILGKTAQIVDSISDLIASREDEIQRQVSRDRMEREMRDNPEKFSRLSDIGVSSAIADDIARAVRARHIQEGKMGDLPEDRTIRFRDPQRTGRQVVEDVFEDIDLDDDPELEEPLEIEQPIEDSDPPFPPFLPPKIPTLTRGGRRPLPGGEPEEPDKPSQPSQPSQPTDDDIINDSIARSLGFQRQQIPQRTFILPDDTKSYNYIEFVRMANANSLFQDNIFNTSF